MIGLPSPIDFRTPGVMSTAKLAERAGIGKNSAPQIGNQFGIRKLKGNAKGRRYPVNITRAAQNLDLPAQYKVF